MKVLITGGAGFIGSHLSERLLGEGHEVFVLDDLSTGNLDNIKHLRDNSHFHLSIGTALDRATMCPLVEHCELVYHLAAAVGVEYVIDNPLLCLLAMCGSVAATMAYGASLFPIFFRPGFPLLVFGSNVVRALRLFVTLALAFVALDACWAGAPWLSSLTYWRGCLSSRIIPC